MWNGRDLRGWQAGSTSLVELPEPEDTRWRQARRRGQEDSCLVTAFLHVGLTAETLPRCWGLRRTAGPCGTGHPSNIRSVLFLGSNPSCAVLEFV